MGELKYIFNDLLKTSAGDFISIYWILLMKSGDTLFTRLFDFFVFELNRIKLNSRSFIIS